MIKYTCSDGSKVSQTQIGSRYKEARKRKYEDSYGFSKTCEGCGGLCNGSAHIIAQARCKQIRKTELIWNPENFFPACNRCNMAIENPKGQEWKTLLNKDYCLEFIQKHDLELYNKFIVNL